MRRPAPPEAIEQLTRLKRAADAARKAYEDHLRACLTDLGCRTFDVADATELSPSAISLRRRRLREASQLER